MSVLFILIQVKKAPKPHTSSPTKLPCLRFRFSNFYRLVSCNYHCLQVLSGRVLLFMTQNEEVQNELLQEQQLRILAATLDLTHDPVRRPDTPCIVV